MKKSGTVKGLNLLCAVLCAVLLVLQFVPFWAEGDGQVSIGGYIWFPSDHKTLDSQLTAEIEGYSIGDAVPLAVLLLVLSAVGIVLCILKMNNALSALVPLACGLVGTVGYLIQPAFRMGAGWQLHCLVCVAMAALAAVTLATGLRRMRQQ